MVALKKKSAGGLYTQKILRKEKLQDESTERHLKDAVDMYRWLAGNLRLRSAFSMRNAKCAMRNERR